MDLDYNSYIGKEVIKLSSGKPFKSGKKINTVKDVINHPILNIHAFTFIEDDSYVECRRCYLYERKKDMKNKNIILEECKCLSSSCIYNIDLNCTKKVDNISPSFMFEVHCPSKIIIGEIRR